MLKKIRKIGSKIWDGFGWISDKLSPLLALIFALLFAIYLFATIMDFSISNLFHCVLGALFFNTFARISIKSVIIEREKEKRDLDNS